MTITTKTNSKKIISLFLTLAMLLTMVPAIGLSTFASETVSYIDEAGATKSASCEDLPTDSQNVTIGSGKWYVVKNTATYAHRIIVTGTANLILADSCVLTASNGIDVSTGNILNIYTAAGVKTTGKIIAGNNSLDFSPAGIGGAENTDCGTVNIYGGDITATSDCGAGIGGGAGGNVDEIGRAGGNVSISGTATVNATSSFGAGIGGGVGCMATGGAGGTVSISGHATVNATSTEGAGIGGGAGIDVGAPANITLGENAVVKTAKGGTDITKNESWGKTLNEHTTVYIEFTETEDPTDPEDPEDTPWPFIPIPWLLWRRVIRNIWRFNACTHIRCLTRILTPFRWFFWI